MDGVIVSGLVVSGRIYAVDNGKGRVEIIKEKNFKEGNPFIISMDKYFWDEFAFWFSKRNEWVSIYEAELELVRKELDVWANRGV